MGELIRARLLEFGYTVNEDADAALILVITDMVTLDVKNMLNVTTIPDGYDNIVVDRIVGEFLRRKKDSGQSVGININAAVKSIRRGDTQTDFSLGKSKSPEERFDDLVEYLINGRTGTLLHERRFKW